MGIGAEGACWGSSTEAGVAAVSGLGRVIGGTRWRLGEGML